MRTKKELLRNKEILLRKTGLKLRELLDMKKRLEDKELILLRREDEAGKYSSEVLSNNVVHICVESI